jgi:hypothetical protein
VSWYGRRALVVALLVVGGCSETSTTNEPQPGGTRLLAALGETLTLTARDGVAVAVSVGAVADPATGSIPPRPDHRYVAIRVRLENVGVFEYRDTPSNGAYLVDDAGHQHGADIADSVLPALGSPRVKPGFVETGFITFEVPEGVEPVRFLLTLNGGFGPETGVWALL